MFSGISETAESRALTNAIAFEEWRENCRDEDGEAGGESMAERAARRRAALPAVISAYLSKDVGTGRNAGSVLARKRKFAAKLKKWVLAVLDGKDGKAAAIMAGFNGTTKKMPCKSWRVCLRARAFPWQMATGASGFIRGQRGAVRRSPMPGDGQRGAVAVAVRAQARVSWLNLLGAVVVHKCGGFSCRTFFGAMSSDGWRGRGAVSSSSSDAVARRPQWRAIKSACSGLE